jgi:succinate dehydrogenase/fumarate reductase-like Fe-S protein
MQCALVQPQKKKKKVIKQVKGPLILMQVHRFNLRESEKKRKEKKKHKAYKAS